MSDLIHIMNTLVDINGKILVTGLYQDVAPITDAEKETYRNIDFKPSEFQSEIGCNKLLHNGEKVKQSSSSGFVLRLGVIVCHVLSKWLRRHTLDSSRDS